MLPAVRHEQRAHAEGWILQSWPALQVVENVPVDEHVIF